MNRQALRQWLVGATLIQSVAVAAFDHIPVAYVMVAKATEVPADILYAVALTESGHLYKGVLVPWPWAINIEGQGYYCRSRREAIELATQAVYRDQSVDLGVVQVNWYWHQQRFKGINDALVPMLNLKAGAVILREQYELSRDWWQAVGRYHDPGEDEASLKSAERYRQRVKQHWRRTF